MHILRAFAAVALLGAVLTMFICTDILWRMVAAIALTFCAYEFFEGSAEGGGPSRNARNPIQTQYIRINLRYESPELKQILGYAKGNDVEQGGRYEIRGPRRLNIWTHTWCNTACRDESCLMFCLEFDLKTSTLMSVALMPYFDWEAFVDELAMLERAALGRSIYGSTRHGPTT